MSYTSYHGAGRSARPILQNGAKYRLSERLSAVGWRDCPSIPLIMAYRGNSTATRRGVDGWGRESAHDSAALRPPPRSSPRCAHALRRGVGAARARSGRRSACGQRVRVASFGARSGQLLLRHRRLTARSLQGLPDGVCACWLVRRALPRADHPPLRSLRYSARASKAATIICANPSGTPT